VGPPPRPPLSRTMTADTPGLFSVAGPLSHGPVSVSASAHFGGEWNAWSKDARRKAEAEAEAGHELPLPSTSSDEGEEEEEERKEEGGMIDDVGTTNRSDPHASHYTTNHHAMEDTNEDIDDDEPFVLHSRLHEYRNDEDVRSEGEQAAPRTPATPYPADVSEDHTITELEQFNRRMRCAALAVDVEAALDTWEAMNDVQVAPSLFTLNTLLRCCCCAIRTQRVPRVTTLRVKSAALDMLQAGNLETDCTTQHCFEVFAQLLQDTENDSRPPSRREW
jgi:hypothetical protein